MELTNAFRRGKHNLKLEKGMESEKTEYYEKK